MDLRPGILFSILGLQPAEQKWVAHSALAPGVAGLCPACRLRAVLVVGDVQPGPPWFSPVTADSPVLSLNTVSWSLSLWHGRW